MGNFVFLTFLQLSKERIYRITSLQEKESKHNLSKLTQVFCGLLSLFSNFFWAEIKCIGATPTVVSFAAEVWPRHKTPSVPRWRESYYVTRP